MDLRDLYYFETLADQGNLGRAGEKLHRTQPALSKSIQRLEETLGTALFFREGRRMSLTPAGELLLMRARHLRQGVQETRREIQDFAKGTVGNVRLGCGPTAYGLLVGPSSNLLAFLRIATWVSDCRYELPSPSNPVAGTSEILLCLSVARQVFLHLFMGTQPRNQVDHTVYL